MDLSATLYPPKGSQDRFHMILVYN